MNDNKINGVVYKATNKINRMVYIGKTISSLSVRKSKHEYDAKNGSNNYFQRALNYYKFENFDWEVIDIASTLNELNEKEIMWIEKTSSFVDNDLGYNMTSGGDNGPVMYGKNNHMFGKKRPEIAKLMSKLKKGVPLKEEHKQKIKNAMQNYVGDDNPAKRKESREKISNNAVKVILNIEGKIFNSINDVCSQLNMSRSTVKQRLNSKSERFKNWKRVGYTNAENNKRYNTGEQNNG